MLDELGKEMCESTINRFNPDYITMDNPDSDGRYVADCGIGQFNIPNIPEFPQVPKIDGVFPQYCPYCGRKIPYWNYNDAITYAATTKRTN